MCCYHSPEFLLLLLLLAWDDHRHLQMCRLCCVEIKMMFVVLVGAVDEPADVMTPAGPIATSTALMVPLRQSALSLCSSASKRSFLFPFSTEWPEIKPTPVRFHWRSALLLVRLSSLQLLVSVVWSLFGCGCLPGLNADRYLLYYNFYISSITFY